MTVCRTILSGTKLDALQRARRVRAMDGAHQRHEGRKEKLMIVKYKKSLRSLRLCGKNS
jgi:hypothetical protein